jgi:type II restriction enzyme
MATADAELAIKEALYFGKALFKFISPNDAGVTGSHQCGFYLPKSAWRLFSLHEPQKGVNRDSFVSVRWQDGRTTDSRVIWYGKQTRNEYRLTRFGRDFPFLNPDSVGSLFILIPLSLSEFHAFVLEFDEDIDEFQAALGVEAIGTWGVYEHGRITELSEDECIGVQFRSFVQAASEFPVTRAFAETVQRVVRECLRNYARQSPDEQLMHCITQEYNLFRMVERELTRPAITRVFRDVDDFIQTAASILNRRKSRAGRSLEHHVERLFTEAAIPFDSKPKIDGKVEPDILIPGRSAYEDASYPAGKLFLVGLKTTCKDRWRQVLNEGKRIERKHILTLQQGISANQLREMNDAQVTLIVPKSIHKYYPAGSGIAILTVQQFISAVRALLI